MLTHPHTLDLLHTWKTSDDQNIPKDLLALLLCNNNKMQISELYDILFKYKKKKQKKEINLENLNTALDMWFTLDNGGYTLRDTEGLSKPTLKLISKAPFSNPKIDHLKLLHENIDNLDVFNPDTAVKVIYKLMDRIKDADINMKKFVGNIENIIKSLDPKFVPKKVFTPRDSLADSSMLNFITKREKIITSVSKFDPIQFDSSVYVYTLFNPNFVTFRKRKDLVTPVKKIFIKFNVDFKPPVYKIQPYQVSNRNSLKKLLNVDYDEDSTWNDEEGEDIVSEESEKEEELSGDEEWVENDSYEVETKKNIKRPMLNFPKIKCVRNEPELFWANLPLEKTCKMSDNLKSLIDEYKGKEYSVQRLSDIFMILENNLKEYLEGK